MVSIGLIFFAVSHSFAVKPEFAEVNQPEDMKVAELEFIGVTEPEFAGVTGIDLFESTAPRPSVTVWGGEQ